MRTGNETKRFIETARTKSDFFKTICLVFFRRKHGSEMIGSISARARIPPLLSPVYFIIYIALLLHHRTYSPLGSDHRRFELCHAILRLLIAIKERARLPFGKYEKIRCDFFLPPPRGSRDAVVFSILLAACHFYPAYVKSLFMLGPYSRIIVTR